MGVQGERRAGTLTALGTVTALAVVVAGGLVGWIRFTSPSAAEPAPATLVEEVPESFDGGFTPAPVPEAVAAAVDRPVVGVVMLDEVPGDHDVCASGLAAGDAELVWAMVTPEGLHVAHLLDEPPWMDMPVEDVERGAVVEGRPVPVPAPATPLAEPVPATPGEPGAERYFESCTAQWERGGWVSGSSMGETVATDQPFPPGMGGSTMCCDAQGLTTRYAGIPTVEGAAWLLQDRGGYWLAYPTAGLDVVPISWRFRENRIMGGPGRAPSTHVLWLDAGGVVVEERYVDG